MTATERPMVLPIVSAPWCEEADGRSREFMREGQTCWGPESCVDLLLERVGHDEYAVYAPHIGAQAYRHWPGEVPNVYVHLDNIELPAGRGMLDDSLHLTPEEALQLAQALPNAARSLIEGSEPTP
jgi:hypothetical protein